MYRTRNLVLGLLLSFMSGKNVQTPLPVLNVQEKDIKKHRPKGRLHHLAGKDSATKEKTLKKSCVPESGETLLFGTL